MGPTTDDPGGTGAGSTQVEPSPRQSTRGEEEEGRSARLEKVWKSGARPAIRRSVI